MLHPSVRVVSPLVKPDGSDKVEQTILCWIGNLARERLTELAPCLVMALRCPDDP